MTHVSHLFSVLHQVSIKALFFKQFLTSHIHICIYVSIYACVCIYIYTHSCINPSLHIFWACVSHRRKTYSARVWGRNSAPWSRRGDMIGGDYYYKPPELPKFSRPPRNRKKLKSVNQTFFRQHKERIASISANPFSGPCQRDTLCVCGRFYIGFVSTHLACPLSLAPSHQANEVKSMKTCHRQMKAFHRPQLPQTKTVLYQVLLGFNSFLGMFLHG